MLASTVGWPDVALALIAAIPGIIAALAALSNRRALKTPSGTSVGRQTEGILHAALGNNYRLQSIGTSLGIEHPARSEAHEVKAEKANGDDAPASPPPRATVDPPVPPAPAAL